MNKSDHCNPNDLLGDYYFWTCRSWNLKNLRKDLMLMISYAPWLLRQYMAMLMSRKPWLVCYLGDQRRYACYTYNNFLFLLLRGWDLKLETPSLCIIYLLQLFMWIAKAMLMIVYFSLSYLQRLPDGVRLRGDIHILLLGDPSTAKSQVG